MYMQRLHVSSSKQCSSVHPGANARLKCQEASVQVLQQVQQLSHQNGRQQLHPKKKKKKKKKKTGMRHKHASTQTETRIPMMALHASRESTQAGTDATSRSIFAAAQFPWGAGGACSKNRSFTCNRYARVVKQF